MLNGSHVQNTNPTFHFQRLSFDLKYRQIDLMRLIGLALFAMRYMYCRTFSDQNHTKTGHAFLVETSIQQHKELKRRLCVAIALCGVCHVSLFLPMNCLKLFLSVAYKTTFYNIGLAFSIEHSSHAV